MVNFYSWVVKGIHKEVIKMLGNNHHMLYWSQRNFSWIYIYIYIGWNHIFHFSIALCQVGLISHTQDTTHCCTLTMHYFDTKDWKNTWKCYHIYIAKNNDSKMENLRCLVRAVSKKYEKARSIESMWWTSRRCAVFIFTSWMFDCKSHEYLAFSRVNPSMQWKDIWRY